MSNFLSLSLSLITGASTESVDLLPTPGSSSLDWTRDLPRDSGAESDQIYEFDGSTNAVVIPESTLSHNLSNKFTISFWMKHESPLTAKGNEGQGSSDGNNKHLKEHILCNADDHSMIFFLSFFSFFCSSLSEVFPSHQNSVPKC